MIEFANGGRLVQDVSELPELRGATFLYADFETTSGSPKEKSINPWRFCDVLGIAVTTDETPGAWYVPVGHHSPEWNLPREPVYDWWCEVLDTAKDWVNHNVKYDAHVSSNWAGCLPAESVRLVDTLTLARIVDSDRLQYALDLLSKDWLKEDISGFEEAFKPYLHRNKDYGAIPGDLMGEYACQDVISNRRLWKYIRSRIPEQCEQVVETEIELTRVLYDMERNGMRVTPDIQHRELKLLLELATLEKQLADDVGYSFRPHTNPDCFSVLCNTYGLPVLGYTDKGDPSFDKHTMAQYAAHPLAPKEIVDGILKYRHGRTIWSNFVKPYQKFAIDEFIHPSYRQCLRTGRMGCQMPNMQQLSSEAKELIIPPEGESFISIDYSQIEFRLIVHYIQDQNAIRAFQEDPDADFHVWVAEMCGIKRKPAKTVNFLTAFGGGKAKLLSALSSNMELVGDLIGQAEELAVKFADTDPTCDNWEQEVSKRFEALARQRAESVHETYHASLPTLKPTSYRAANACKRRGFVFNLYGRRRHLPAKASYRAFNTLNQSSAADMMKERTVAVAKAVKGTPIKIVGSVHDETLFTAPHEIANDPRVHRDLVGILESPLVEDVLRVPIRCSIGVSAVNWRIAGSDAATTTLQYDKKDCENLEFLK